MLYLKRLLYGSIFVGSLSAVVWLVLYLANLVHFHYLTLGAVMLVLIYFIGGIIAEDKTGL